MLALLAALAVTSSQPPAGTRLLDGLPNAFELDAGEEVLVRGVCRISRIAVSVQPFDVKPIGSDELLIEGYEPGRGTLILWCADGTRRSALITVKPNEALGAARKYLHAREKLGDAAPVPPGFQQGEANALVQLKPGGAASVALPAPQGAQDEASVVNEAPDVVDAVLGSKSVDLVARQSGVAVVRVRRGQEERVYLVVVKG